MAMLDSTAPTSPAALRSFLFAPASDLRRAQRALASPAHAAILDLEDAVADAEKADARDIVQSLLSQASDSGKLDRPARLLRVNGAETPFFEGDLALLERIDVDAVVLPKASVTVLESPPERFPPVYALVESATGLREAFALARSARVVGLMLGAVDLAADLGLDGSLTAPSYCSRSLQLVRDSRAAAPSLHRRRLEQLDDPEGLMREAALDVRLGCSASCIHPGQLDTVHAASPPRAGARLAQRCWTPTTPPSRAERARSRLTASCRSRRRERARRLLSEAAPDERRRRGGAQAVARSLLRGLRGRRRYRSRLGPPSPRPTMRGSRC